MLNWLLLIDVRSAADVQGKPHCKLESSVQINSFMAALLCQKLSQEMKMEYI